MIDPDQLRAALAEAWPGETNDPPDRAGLQAALARARRRRTLRRSAGGAAAVAVVIAGVVLLSVAGGPAAQSRLRPTAPPSLAPSAAPGHGDAAVVTPAGTLELVGLAGTTSPTVVAEGRRTVADVPATGVISSPSFSPDGEDLVWQVQQASGYATLEEASVATPARHRMLDRGVLAAAWSPVADQLAVLQQNRLQLLAPAGAVLASWAVTDGSGPAFSPDGTTIAVGLRGGRVELFPVTGAAPSSLSVPTTAQHGEAGPSCAEVAGWTADSSRVLVWNQLACSSSIGADGLALLALPVSGARPESLGQSLAYPDWVVPVSGTQVIVDRGGDRVASDAKRLVRCDAATGACSPLPLPAGMSALDPAAIGCTDTPPGSCRPVLVWTETANATQPVDDLAGIGATRLWVGDAAGGAPVRAAGTQVADPQADPAARYDVLFLRASSHGEQLSLERLDLATMAVSTLATLEPGDYYGHVNAAAVLAVEGDPGATRFTTDVPVRVAATSAPG